MKTLKLYHEPVTRQLENVIKKKQFHNKRKPKSDLTLNVIKISIIIMVKTIKEYQIILKYIKGDR